VTTKTQLQQGRGGGTEEIALLHDVNDSVLTVLLVDGEGASDDEKHVKTRMALLDNDVAWREECALHFQNDGADECVGAVAKERHLTRSVEISQGPIHENCFHLGPFPTLLPSRPFALKMSR
jgi:hypothetical protein